MRALVPHLANTPIRINTIAPSWTDTAVAPGARVRATGAQVLEPGDVARLTLGLMGDEGRKGLLVHSKPKKSGGVEHWEIDEGLRAAAEALCGGQDGGPSLEEVLVGMVRNGMKI